MGHHIQSKGGSSVNQTSRSVPEPPQRVDIMQKIGGELTRIVRAFSCLHLIPTRQGSKEDAHGLGNEEATRAAVSLLQDFGRRYTCITRLSNGLPYKTFSE